MFHVEILGLARAVSRFVTRESPNLVDVSGRRSDYDEARHGAAENVIASASSPQHGSSVLREDGRSWIARMT